MPKKINCLIFSDFEIPNYDRNYRGILFMEWSDSSIYKFYIVSPFSKSKFKKPVPNHETYYYENQNQMKKQQYRILSRLKGFCKLFFALLKFKKINKEINIVYVGTTYALLLATIFKINNIKIIANICDFYSDLYKGYKMPFGNLLEYPIKFLEKKALSLANVITVDTYAQKRLLITNYAVNKNKCVVLPNGLVTDNFPYIEKKDESIMRTYNYSKEDLVFFYGGDISEDDGIELIIRFANEHKNRKNFKFLIIGKGNDNYIKKLNLLISKLGLFEKFSIESFKPIDELYKYISVADICLAPFKVTNTTNVTEVSKIISYLLGGKVVISTKAEGVCSLYGDYVTYFEDGNYNDFKTKIIEKTSKTLSKKERLSIRRHAEKFDVKNIIKTEYQIVEELMTQKNPDFEDFNFKI